MRDYTVLRNRYRLAKFIDRGGMADVYLAFDEYKQVWGAIKLLCADLAKDPEFARRFRCDAEALADLDHHRFSLRPLTVILEFWLLGFRNRGECPGRHSPRYSAFDNLLLACHRAAKPKLRLFPTCNRNR